MGLNVIVTVYLFLIFHQSIEAGNFKDDVRYCLEETDLKLLDLGLTSIDDVEISHLTRIHELPQEKKYCYMACWFKLNDVIDERGVINYENLVEPLPGKTFPKSFNETINECKAKTSYCQVGGCLYEVYYT